MPIGNVSKILFGLSLSSQEKSVVKHAIFVASGLKFASTVEKK